MRGIPIIFASALAISLAACASEPGGGQTRDESAAEASEPKKRDRRQYDDLGRKHPEWLTRTHAPPAGR